MSALSIGESGLTMAAARFDRSAVKTADDISQGKDVVSDFVEQVQSRAAFEASISVVKTADQMTGRLLNMKV